MYNRLLYMAVAILGLSLGFFAASGYLSRTSFAEAATIGQDVRSFGELTERFAKLAKEKGAAYAFDILRIAKVPPNTDTHLLGHSIGEMLYQEKGVAGMADCTQDFRNACSHAIVIGTMGEYGDAGAPPLIQEACRSAPGGTGAYTMCYHGLGHGVFAYFGYDLAKTVAYCQKFGTEARDMRESVECVGGTIMELVGGGGHARTLWLAAREKYITPDPFSPCMSSALPDDDMRSICLMYMTPELVARAGGSASRFDPRYFAKAMSLCDTIPASKQDLRDSCYGGFGKEFVPLANDHDIRTVDRMSDAQYATAVTWCNYAKSADGKDSCIRSEVASVMWGGETNPDTWFRFCGLISGTLQDSCYDELAGSIYQYIRDERRTALCKRLPDTYQAVCKEGA